MTLRNPPSGNASFQAVGYGTSNRQSAAYPSTPSWSVRQSGNTSISANGKVKGRFPHIKDLQGKANITVKDIDPRAPIRTLLNHAQQSTNQVATDVSFKRPDRAYVEYLVSSELLLNVIPRHKDYPSINSGRVDWQQIYKSLRKQNDTQHEMCKQIYNVIVEDNAKSGVKPLSYSSSSTSSLPSSSSEEDFQPKNGHPRPLSMPDTSNSVSNRASDELHLPPSHTIPSVSDPHQPLSHWSSKSPKGRPVAHPKPISLQAATKSRSRESLHTSDDILAERFSHIKVQRKNAPAGSRFESRQRSAIDELPSPTEDTPSSSDESSSFGFASHGRSGFLPSLGKPSGPREMQPIMFKPQPPPKIPLDTNMEVQLPRAPSPAYDPSKSIVTPIKTSLPALNRKRSIIGTESVSPQSANPLSGYGSVTGYSHSTRSSASYEASPLARSTIAIGRSQQSISAAELYEYVKMSNVLLIDVRSREQFDQGHIFAKSVMCIEPISLKPGLSAEELEERLVISPEPEQIIFERRDEFDLVVYYDQETASDRFLKGPPTETEADALRALHDTLYEFNDYKPLRRRPVFIRGGLNAWTDLVGSQALATSQTAVLVGSTRARRPIRSQGRPIGRVPMASANSSLEVRKRRLRDQNPLNADEQRTWLEKAHREAVDPAEYEHAQRDGDSDTNSDEPLSPFVHTYEDFLRRFPDASPIQQSMMVPSPPPPRSHPPLPQPPLSSMPSVPSRPPPALPRPSYGGVSERDSSQFSPTSRQTSSTQHPLYMSRSISHYMKLPRTGLINFSVTCYMNATIQCLLATIPLSHFFLDNKWKDLVQENWKGSNGIMPGIFANLIRSLWKDDVQAIRPSSLRKFCARLNPEWGVDRQQDAKEFFDFLVGCLHEDLNVNWDRNPLRPLTFKEEMERERMPIQRVSKIEWNRYSHREKSRLSDLFAGQHASRLRCTTCNNTSTTYEAFYSISVEIPRTSGKRPWDVNDCLRSYCQEERLSGDEVWKCPHCKCEREATKKITISRAPQFLVVHFKRFEVRKGESARKVHTPIGFPLFGLNMEPYMVPPFSKGSRDLYGTDDLADPATTPPYLYDAYAVMRHIGASGNGGHYISLVRDAGRGNIWRKFDDERVTDFDPQKLKPDQRLQNEQAYLVFYGRAVAR